MLVCIIAASLIGERSDFLGWRGLLAADNAVGGGTRESVPLASAADLHRVAE